MNLVRRLFLGLIITGLCLTSICQAADETNSYFDSLVAPENLSEARISQVVVDTLIGRKWIIREKSDEKVVGYLLHHGHEAQVTIEINDQKVVINSWGFEVNGKGVRTAQRIQVSWLRNLRADLSRNLYMQR